jgi:hypothetical protein
LQERGQRADQVAIELPFADLLVQVGEPAEEDDEQAVRRQAQPIEEGDLAERPARQRLEAAEDDLDEDEAGALIAQSEDNLENKVDAVLHLATEGGRQHGEGDAVRSHLSLPVSARHALSIISMHCCAMEAGLRPNVIPVSKIAHTQVFARPLGPKITGLVHR